MQHPVIIQGGMGAGVSGWRLARAVAERGQLGVVSGTALATLLVRNLQLGDVGGHYRRAVASFPNQEIARRMLERYFVDGGIGEGGTFMRHPMYGLQPSRHLIELTALAAFAEVFLAKDGHDGLVGINLLEKIVLANLPSLYGAMLAGVDYVLMGAGIPMEIPGALDKLSRHEPAALTVPVIGAEKGEEFWTRLDPQTLLCEPRPVLKRPHFLAIIASNVLAIALHKRATGRVDGFIVEAPTAGGHNAPPRGALQLNERDEPIYGPKDEVNLEDLKKLGVPFWLAGSRASSERVRDAIEQGAVGIQAGTVFALCEESGLAPELREALIEQVLEDKVDVFTDRLASPTGFPFKLAQIKQTLSEPEVYEARPRRCDLGYLRAAYKKENGEIDFRCPAEPEDQYARKGGNAADTAGRKCLCNGLTATIDLPQRQSDGYIEAPLVTIGDDLINMKRFFPRGQQKLCAAEVIESLLAGSV